ncbi:hypothetical protein [Labrenzia sp. PHM005]|uniref:hypothetical protein n=1 Tax=Labrenzia sp. PHM005 TaxID=2590016 RepID=UPI00143DB0CA|nr:hypothetical protein [Labrenzia sp. PHM005]
MDPDILLETTTFKIEASAHDKTSNLQVDWRLYGADCQCPTPRGDAGHVWLKDRTKAIEIPAWSQNTAAVACGSVTLAGQAETLLNAVAVVLCLNRKLVSRATAIASVLKPFNGQF